MTICLTEMLEVHTMSMKRSIRSLVTRRETVAIMAFAISGVLVVLVSPLLLLLAPLLVMGWMLRTQAAPPDDFHPGPRTPQGWSSAASPLNTTSPISEHPDARLDALEGRRTADRDAGAPVIAAIADGGPSRA